MHRKSLRHRALENKIQEEQGPGEWGLGTRRLTSGGALCMPHRSRGNS